MRNNKLKIEYGNINDFTLYKNNARKHAEKDVDAIKASIEKFGFNDAIAVWGDKNIVVEGHGRIQAAKELGITKIPYVRLDHLTDEERKAYTIAHNRTAELSKWDNDILKEEIQDLIDFDFDFDFDLDYLEQDKENERVRTNNTYNLDLIDNDNSTNDFWQMPIIKNDNFIPDDLIGFNYAKSSKNKNAGIHFYIDDYQFERIWTSPEKYLNILKEYECILSPDFSLYTDMQMPMKIWNIYRSRLIGSYYQNNGIKVIPTISWAEKETFSFCFQGIPKNSIVSVSTIGVKRDKDAMKIWREGMDEMIKQIEPSVILIYGGEVEYDYQNIETIYFNNKVTEKMKER